MQYIKKLYAYKTEYMYFDARHVLDLMVAGEILIGWNNHVI